MDNKEKNKSHITRNIIIMIIIIIIIILLLLHNCGVTFKDEGENPITDVPEIKLTYNTASQTANILTVTNGNGNYTYREKTEQGSNGTATNYISLSGTTLTIESNTPAGVYTYVVTVTDTETGTEKDVEYTLTIDRKSISIPTCESFTYNKSEQTLIDSTDEYTASDNKATNAGNYDVKLVPTSNYKWSDNTTGEKQVRCVIDKYDISTTSTVVPTSNVTYNGREYKPTPTVKVPLPSSVQTYTLTSSEVSYSYENNKDAGTATITIKGVGNYKGEITQNFTIEKAKGYVNLSEINKNISYGTNSVSFTVTSSHGGTLSVSDNNSTATSSVIGTTVTLENLGTLSSGTTVIATVKSQETNNYTEGSATYTITVSKTSLSGGKVVITGKNIVGSTLTANVTDTTPTANYTYEWYRNTSASSSGGEKISGATNSTYTVTSSDVGSYIYVVVKASKANYDSTSFSDVVDATNNVTETAKNSVAKPDTTYCKSLTYNGNSQVLTNTATEGYAFYDNSGIYAGEYTITAKLINNYIWNDDTSSDVTFKCSISPKNITLTAGTSSRAYNGSALTNSTCTSSGLISGDTVECTMTSGSTITNAGSVDNEISTYIISKDTTDVTSSYNVTKEKGTLTVTKVTPTVTLNEKTAEQLVYTGSAIEANTATVDPNVGAVTYTYYTNSECTQGATTVVPTNAGTYYVKATTAASENYNEGESSCVAHTIMPKIVDSITNLSISTNGVVSWTNSSDATSYQISIDNINWTSVPKGTTTTSYNYLNTITGSTGTRTIYVRAINSDTTNYTTSATINTTTTVYTLTINSNNTDYGTISPSSINVISGVTYTTSGNTLSLSDGRSVTASPITKTGCTTLFDSWSTNSGTINAGTTLTANFTREQIIYNITFNANTGTFNDSNTTNSVSYKIRKGSVTKYSHTSNIDDTGLKTTNYGNYWTNANIAGTDRGDTTKAHVVTIPEADSLTVDLYYNGESISYDWVSVWAGNYPNYTASSDYNSTGAVTTEMGGLSTNKYGGSGSGSYTVNGNSLTSMGYSQITIPGDTVTFGFKSDSGGYGNGYGYYAIISGTGMTLVNNSGTYKEPTKEGKLFIGWNTESDGSGTTYKDEASLSNLTDTSLILYAQYRNPTATFKTGQEFNAAIKQLSGLSSATYSTSNSTITAFTKYNGTPSSSVLSSATIVSSADSESEIYAWFNNGTIYWYTTSDTVYFNQNSSYMFNYLTAIDTIDLSNFDLSNVNVTNSSSMFSNTTNMTTLITPKVNASSSISIDKTMINSSNTTYSSLTSTMTPITTLKVPYTITFDKNGGVSSSCTSTSLTKQIYPGNPVGTIPSATFTKLGYTIDGWQTEQNGGSAVTESTIPPSSKTYYAKWVKNGVFAEDIKNNSTYANANCESIQCMLEYFMQFREKRVDING